MALRLMLLTVGLILSGCSLFGRSTVAHDRYPFIPEATAPQLDLQPNPPAHVVQNNFNEIATYAIRMRKGILVYNEIALQHNIAYGFIKPEEVAEYRKRFGIPPPPPDQTITETNDDPGQ